MNGLYISYNLLINGVQYIGLYNPFTNNLLLTSKQDIQVTSLAQERLLVSGLSSWGNMTLGVPSLPTNLSLRGASLNLTLAACNLWDESLKELNVQTPRYDGRRLGGY